MTGIKPTRRWLQFRLRSLMLLIFFVSIWLGFESRHANSLGRHVAAIRDAGGQVEFETCCWSLLRFLDAERYGAKIVSAEIGADTMDSVWDHVAALKDVRELRVAFDGTSDMSPVLDRLLEALPGARITPIVAEITGDIASVWEPLRVRNNRGEHASGFLGIGLARLRSRRAR